MFWAMARCFAAAAFNAAAMSIDVVSLATPVIMTVPPKFVEKSVPGLFNSFARHMSALVPEIANACAFAISTRHVCVAHGVRFSTNPYRD
jgi:hypothetical protein